MYPVFLKLEDKPCLVIGGGKVAQGKTADLLESGARVTIISPDLTESLERLVSNNKVEYKERPYQKGDSRGYVLIIAATNKKEINRMVYEEASRKGILINSVDDPESCSFYAPALLKRGSLKIAVSTGGKLPMLAGRIKRLLASLVPEDAGDRLDELGELRRRIIAEAGGNREIKNKEISERLIPRIDDMMDEWNK